MFPGSLRDAHSTKRDCWHGRVLPELRSLRVQGAQRCAMLLETLHLQKLVGGPSQELGLVEDSKWILWQLQAANSQAASRAAFLCVLAGQLIWYVGIR